MRWLWRACFAPVALADYCNEASTKKITEVMVKIVGLVNAEESLSLYFSRGLVVLLLKTAQEWSLVNCACDDESISSQPSSSSAESSSSQRFV